MNSHQSVKLCAIFILLTPPSALPDDASYGEVVFRADTPATEIVAISTTLTVPPKPAGKGDLFIWPGLQPNLNSLRLSPIETGVLQPVLTWGESCAPTSKPEAYKTWWISGQYVNTVGHEPGFTDCHSGPSMPVGVGDSLLVYMTLDGLTWNQTITDLQTQHSVSFAFGVQKQQQGDFLLSIEQPPGSGAVVISPVTFRNTQFTLSRPSRNSCLVFRSGPTDSVSTPRSSERDTICTIDRVSLRAKGIK